MTPLSGIKPHSKSASAENSTIPCSTKLKSIPNEHLEIFIAFNEKSSMNQILLYFTVLLISVGFTPMVFAEPTVEIILEKSTYNYGEKLFYTIKVSEVTGDNAVIHIRDESGKGSSAIPIGISQLETPIPSLYPFEREVFPEGKFFIDVEYSGAKNTAEFNLVDVGNIVIPFWIKQVAFYWISPDGISDKNYADAIEFLIKEEIIMIPETTVNQNGQESKIPSWVKTSTLWWLEEKISDSEYAQALQHLIKIGIIVI